MLQLYIGDGGLRSNTTYDVQLFGLRSRLQTQAYINGARVTVNYLVTVDSTLSLSDLQGNLFIGGYRDVSDLRVCSFDKLIVLLTK